MIITVAEAYTFNVTSDELEIPILTFLRELYRENPKVINCPQIRFETLILHRISKYDGYVILGQNPPLLRRGFVSTFDQDLSITARSSADTEAALQQFALNKRLLHLSIQLKGTTVRSASGELQLWKHDEIVCVQAEGIVEKVPPL